MRRVLIIGGSILGVAVLVAAGVFFRLWNPSGTSSNPSPYQNTDNLPPGTGTLPDGAAVPTSAPQATVSGAQKFGVVTDGPVLDYFVDGQNNVLFVEPDGSVSRLSGGTKIVLSSIDISGISRASFSADGKKVFVIFGDADVPQTSVFDVVAKSWRPLSADIKEPVWSPTGERIAFLSSNSPDFSVLATLDLASAKSVAQPLTRIYAQDLVLSWPSANTLILGEKSSAYAAGSVWRYDLTTRTLRPALESFPALETRFAPDGKTGVAFTGNTAFRGGVLNMVDMTGSLGTSFNLTTIPSKCAFQTETIPVEGGATSTGKTSTVKKTKDVVSVICGFPKNIDDFNLLPQPDSYYQKKFFSEDLFYKIDLATGAIADLLPDAPYILDANNLKVFGKKLFFVNRYDRRLYTISLE